MPAKNDVGVVAAAGVPHAPQFWSMPDTEDPGQVEAMRRAMAKIGQRLQGYQPDVLIMLGNDHTENYFKACVPSFSVHCGLSVGGRFGSRSFQHLGAGELGYDVVEQLQSRGFDPAFTNYAELSYAYGIPLDFCEIAEDLPVLPVFVNAYLPPQPSPERCFAFGAALHEACVNLGLRAIMIGSGGMSHYPGTGQYAHPDVETDKTLLGAFQSGDTRRVLSYDIKDLDDTGNLELLPWIALAGAVGQRTPDVWEFAPSWHHVYTAIGWTEPIDRTRGDRYRRYYPAVQPALERASDALYALRYDIGGACARYHADQRAFAAEYQVEPTVAEALVDFDDEALLAAGLHPFLVSGAKRRLTGGHL